MLSRYADNYENFILLRAEVVLILRENLVNGEFGNRVI